VTRRARLAIIPLVALSAAVWAQDHTVRTWDGRESRWTVTDADLRGLTIETSGRESVVGWQRVRAVEGPLADKAEPYLDPGETAWRASSRLERGDAFGAEPLFESLFERYEGVEGPTAAVVAEGLLRCRLRRDARASAVEAWLDLYANLSDAPARTPRWGVGSVALDAESLLCPSLPPVWFAGPAAEAFAARFEAPVSPEDVTGAVRALYAAAALAVLNEPIDASVTSRAVAVAQARASAGFVADLVLAQVGGAEARANARAALERARTPSAEPWRRVWATIAIGRSLAAEPGESARRRGVLELISVHALDRGVSPYLAGVALADAALASDRLGDTAAASALLDELRGAAPSHPVWDSPPVAELSSMLASDTNTTHGRVSSR